MFVIIVSLFTDLSIANSLKPGCFRITLSLTDLYPVLPLCFPINPDRRPLNFAWVQRSSIFPDFVSQLLFRDRASSKSFNVGHCIFVTNPVTQSFVNYFFNSVRSCPEFQSAHLAITLFMFQNNKMPFSSWNQFRYFEFSPLPSGWSKIKIFFFVYAVCFIIFYSWAMS